LECFTQTYGQNGDWVSNDPPQAHKHRFRSMSMEIYSDRNGNNFSLWPRIYLSVHRYDSNNCGTNLGILLEKSGQQDPTRVPVNFTGPASQIVVTLLKFSSVLKYGQFDTRHNCQCSTDLKIDGRNGISINSQHVRCIEKCQGITQHVEGIFNTNNSV